MNLSNFAAEKIFSWLLFMYLFIYLFIYLFMQYLARVTLSVYRMGNFRNTTVSDIECRDPGSGSGLQTYHKKTNRSC